MDFVAKNKLPANAVLCRQDIEYLSLYTVQALNIWNEEKFFIRIETRSVVAAQTLKYLMDNEVGTGGQHPEMLFIPLVRLVDFVCFH